MTSTRITSMDLPPANDTAPPYSPPVEEKIPYDPSAAVARQRSQKDAGSTFRDWDANEPTDRKTPHAPSIGAPDMSQSRSPVHYPVGDYAENDPRSDHCLPEVVVGSTLPEVVDVSQRRQTMASTIQSPQPYTPNVETMSMAPTQFLTVTPLHLLGDQPDMIDCPFCLRRTETKVIREASPVTHIIASLCCVTTGLGVFAPYMLDWAAHIEQHCTNCNRRVTRKPHGRKEVEIFGTPAEQRMPSRYPAAEFPPDDEVPPPPPAKTYTRPNDPRPTEMYTGREF